MRSSVKIVFRASCYNCIGASCYNCNNAGTARTDGSASELCADNNCKSTIYLTTTCEHFISLEKPRVLFINSTVNASNVKQNLQISQKGGLHIDGKLLDSR